MNDDDDDHHHRQLISCATCRGDFLLIASGHWSLLTQWAVQSVVMIKITRITILYSSSSSPYHHITILLSINIINTFSTSNNSSITFGKTNIFRKLVDAYTWEMWGPSASIAWAWLSLLRNTF